MDLPSELRNEHAIFLIEIIKSTFSGNENIRKPAEQKLSILEKIPGYISLLINIANEQTLENNLKLFCIISIKNTIERYWKKTSELSNIQDGEKELIKKNIWILVKDPNLLNVKNLGEAISKISRQEFPEKWTNLFDVLYQLCNSDIDTKLRTLIITEKIIYQLSGIKTKEEKERFKQVAEKLFPYYYNTWKEIVGLNMQFLSSIFGQNGEMKGIDQQSAELFSKQAYCGVLLLKILKDLILRGFTQHHKYPILIEFFKNLLAFLFKFVNIFSQFDYEKDPRFHKIKKQSLVAIKILIETQKKHPDSFGVLMGEESINLILGVFFHQNSARLVDHTRLLTIFLKNIVIEKSYQADKYEMDKINHSLISTKLMNTETLTKLSNVLFFKNLVLTQDEIEKSLSDEEHEEIYSEIGDFDIESNLFNASTSLVIALFENFPNTFCPIVLQSYQYLQQNNDIQNVDQLKISLLKKECLYHIIGLGSFQLYDHIDFSGWFVNQLIHELSDNKIPQVEMERVMLKRRVVWMIGKWVSKISKDLRVKLYPLLLHYLSDKKNSKLIRFETAKSLTCLISDYDFVIEDFLNFVTPTANLVFSLINEMETNETITFLFSQFELILEQLGNYLSNELDNLFQNVVLMWQKSLKEATIQSSILRIVCQLTRRCANATKYYSFLVPLLKYSTELDNEASIYLIEDGLDLWVRVLKIAPELNNDFVSLYSNVFPIISNNLEHYKFCLQITEAYIFLGGKNFLTIYIKDIINFFSCIIGEAKDKVCLNALSLLDTLLVVHSTHNFITNLFPLSYPLFQKILSLFLDENESVLLRTHLMNVLWRFFSVAPNNFLELIKVCSNNQNPFILLSTFVEKSLERMDNISETGKKKLISISFSNLLNICPNEKLILQKFPSIFNFWLSTLALVETRGEHIGFDDFISSNEEVSDYPYERERLKCYIHDSVNTINLRNSINATMEKLKSVLGETSFGQLVGSVDPKLIEEFKNPMKN